MAASASDAETTTSDGERDLCDPNTWDAGMAQLGLDAAHEAARWCRRYFKGEYREMLFLNDNALRTLPDALFALLELEELRLYGNNLERIQPEMARLTNLRILDLGYNSLRELSGAILSALPNLRELYLPSNRLTTLPCELFDLPLEVLDLENCGVKGGLPDALWDMTTLEQLAVGKCGLDTLPPAVGNLVHLTRFSVDHTPTLTELPTTLDQITKLEYFSCIHSGLTSFPTALGDLTALTHLIIYGCKSLTTLPRDIGRCKSLETLECYDSGLKSLPLELGLLPKLKRLRCFGMELEDHVIADLVDSFYNSPELLAHLRQRAQQELSGRLVKRAV